MTLKVPYLTKDVCILVPSFLLLIHLKNIKVKLENDGTYRTQSTLVFPASRFEDNKSLYCEAKNEVIEYYEEEPVKADAK